ncbi:MAG: RNA chaperone Hfq [Candidatus Omnitrophota bacterium]|jgi:host factor-I protein|nr:MAG: RNA chaperone Hfq [Candidatus Omnitrophota bacterium]
MVVKSVMNIQDSFLNQARRERISLDIHLVDGTDLHGKISAFDNFTIILMNDEREEQYLIYKHAVATIMPGAKTRVRWNQMGEMEKPRPTRDRRDG